MKKLLLCLAMLVPVASGVLADPFAPELLKLTAAPTILYQFDGSGLNIPVTVTGPMCGANFLVFTKGKAATMPKIVNGYLGWHEVNKIDTCLYISPRLGLSKGSNTITWDGKDEAGNKVGAGDYTYYIWAVDDVNVRTQMTKQISMGAWNFRAIVTKNTDGTPKAQPVIYQGAGARGTRVTEAVRLQYKWTVGSDPLDATLRETSMCMMVTDNGGPSRDPKNEMKFWTQSQLNNGYIEVKKWTWVPNGVAMQDADDLKWGTDGKFQYSSQHMPGSLWGWGTVNDGKDYIWVSNADAFTPTTTQSEIITLDINDGSEVKRIDLAEWWIDMADGAAGGQNVGGPSEFYLDHGTAVLGSHSTCVNQCINPYAEDAASLSLWVNGNGDYVGDHNWEVAPSTNRKWVCNDYYPGDYKYNITQDRNGFTGFPCYGSGAKSFGLYAPDGQAVGYIALAGETAYQKYGLDFIDYDSAYDGLLTTSNVGRTTAGADGTFWWVGMDSIKGTLTNKVGVDEAAPAAFSVAQNTPNPFNPTTTINFTLAKAGQTTVEVFNVAGQRVDTILNASMSAGQHSVTWDAKKFSAGVYFGTVRSGSLTKTIKMTLLK